MTDLEHQAARLWSVLAEESDFPVDAITRASRLGKDLNLSGVQRISLAFRVEAEFGIRLTEKDYDAITNSHATVATVWQAVERHLSAKETTK